MDKYQRYLARAQQFIDEARALGPDPGAGRSRTYWVLKKQTKLREAHYAINRILRDRRAPESARRQALALLNVISAEQPDPLS